MARGLRFGAMKSEFPRFRVIALAAALAGASCESQPSFQHYGVQDVEKPCAHVPGGNHCNTCVVDDAGAPTSRCAGVVILSDPRLEAAVRNALGIATAPILATDAELVIRLLIQPDGAARADEGALSLQGINCLTNLTDVTIRMPVVDLTPLTALPCLEICELDNGAVRNLSSLPRLPGVGALGLRNNNISDISPIAKFSEFGRLDLSNNAIADLTVFTSAHIPSILDLRSNVISNLSPLAANKMSAGSRVLLQQNPIDCATQARNFQILRLSQVSVATDCPSP